MKRYSKVVANGCILLICDDGSGIEITESEYNEILSVIRACPTPPEGKSYRLKTDFTWELYDLPHPEPEPVSLEDIATALEEIL